MCGIVGYFGGAGNNLTRVLTGMSAIIYRAPDSTGVGLFGDETEPLRARKSLGSAAKLSEVLLKDAAYPNHAEKLISFWEQTGEVSSCRERQRRLLKFEGFSPQVYESFSQGRQKYVSYDELIELNAEPVRLSPGWPGSPKPMPVFFIRSRQELVRTIRELTAQYDLSFIVIQTLIRNTLSQSLSKDEKEGRLDISPSDVLTEFDQLFEKVFMEEKRPKPVHTNREWSRQTPQAMKYLRRYLKKTPVRIPRDYDRDGVRCVFRLLDAALLCRLPVMPELSEAIQVILESLWPDAARLSEVNWKTLYWAEKGANIYGWAAASVLTWLQREELLPELLKGVSEEQLMTAESVVPGQTDPVCLRFFSSPILSQGRWALQSPVTLKNAHPFFDAHKHRAVGLNGQFNGEVEAEVRSFLEKVAKFSFRSENSTEYFSLLWGYYFEQLRSEIRRYDAIRSQNDAGLEEYYSIGSQAIDYQVWRRMKDKTPAQTDETAFLEAARRMKRDGGQIAVTGISLYSPRCFYAAVHNRPAYIVRRTDADDFMIVSDINAAMGLFPQSLIHRKTLELNRLGESHAKNLANLRAEGANKKRIDACKKEHLSRENAILEEAFRVDVFPLEDEEIFVRIKTIFERGELRRKLRITDFDGNPLPDIEPFDTVLSPLHIRKDLYGSFYETHLHEIPDRMGDILQFYMAEEGAAPQFALRERFLRRRFGKKFASLRRIILTGMGSAYHVGLMARSFFQEMIPKTEVMVIRPAEVSDISKLVIPEKDLVILLSWSGATADMVEFAKVLKKNQVAMIALTEKVFADMALIARKSCGVIPVMSGEEVTVSGIKSVLCMLLCLDLFGMWLASQSRGEDESAGVSERLGELPRTISELLEDEAVKEFTESLASESSGSHAAVVFGALHSVGTTREAAFKLEENSWTAIGKCMDYQDFAYQELEKDLNENLVLVNATSEARLSEALSLMKKLYISDIPFAVVSYENDDKAEIDFYSRGRAIYLPKIEDALQPFIDLIFYYLFTFEYAKAHGRNADDFPRNLVKSVTAGRSRPQKLPTPAAEFQKLETSFRFPVSSSQLPVSDFRKLETLWESQAVYEWEKNYYRRMRRLSQVLCEADPLSTLIKSLTRNPKRLVRVIFEDLSEEGEMILVPFDRASDVAARNAAYQWQRFTEFPIRIAKVGEPLARFSEDAILILIASGRPSDRTLSERIRGIQGSCVWIGPKISEPRAEIFRRSLGYFVLVEGMAFIESDFLYAALSLLLINAWKMHKPEKAKILEKHFQQAEPVIQAILNNASLERRISEIMTENRDYRTAFFLCPPLGTGPAWMDMFDQSGGMAFQWHLYGESSFGPLVTVDGRVENKFVRLGERSRMISEYGENRVAEWESRYMGGKDIDRFLKQSPENLPRAASPFFAEGNWYIPVLKKNYDAIQDNLIIMDATRRRYSDQTLDELATYGCRHARMVVISQEAFQNASESRAMYKYPVSHLILLPSPEGEGETVPIPGFLLPFAMNLVGMRMASAAAQVRGVRLRRTSEESAFERAFGHIGSIMIRHRMDIHYMGPHLIESLKNLSPMISGVEGTARHAVREIRNEAELLEMAGKNRLYSPEDTLENFRIQSPSRSVFYLLRPETEIFEGSAKAFADRSFGDDYRNLWSEPYGNIWKVLTHQILGIQENPEGLPLLMIPFIDRDRRIGWLYYLHAHFTEWDHGLSFEDEVGITVRALGKEMSFHEYISPRYPKIVSRFNDEMVHHGHTWDDRLLGFVKRSLLFYKPSKELAELLAERVLALLALKHLGVPFATEYILDTLEKNWGTLRELETSDDAARWEGLCAIWHPSLVS